MNKQLHSASLRLMLALLSLFATANAFAGGSDFYFKATAEASGQGKVYVSEKKQTSLTAAQYQTSMETGVWSQNSSGEAATSTVYLYALADDGYAFSHWSYEASGEGKHTNDSLEPEIEITSTSKEEGNPQVRKFVANFVKQGDLRVKASDSSLGAVSSSNISAVIGDEVTLTASPERLVARFVGWQKEGSSELIAQNPLTLTITEATTYTAVFEAYTNGFYCLLKNKGNGGALGLVGTAQSDLSRSQRGFTHSIAAFTAAQAATTPAAVVRISGTPQGQSLEKCNMISQGIGVGDIKVNTSASKEFKLTKYEDNAYLIQGMASSLFGYLSGNDYCESATTPNYGATKHPALYNRSETYPAHLWQVFPLTEEDMDTHYVGVTARAENAVSIDGETRYLSSLYASFPFRCYDGMDAYYVSRVEADKAFIVKIDGGEVPSLTPVLLACKGLSPKENRYLPLYEEPKAVSGNLLRGVIDLNDEQGEESYRTAFDAETMRVVPTSGGVLSASNPETVGTSDEVKNKYLLTNTAYLPVASGTPEALTLVVSEPEPEPIMMKQSQDGGKSMYTASEDGDIAIVLDETEQADVFTIRSYRQNGFDAMQTVALVVQQMKDFARMYFGVDEAAAAEFVDAFDSHVYMRQQDAEHYYSFIKAPETLEPLRQWVMAHKDELSWTDARVEAFVAAEPGTDAYRDAQQAVLRYIVDGIQRHLGEAFITDPTAADFVKSYADLVGKFAFGEAYYMNLGTYAADGTHSVPGDNVSTLTDDIDGYFTLSAGGQYVSFETGDKPFGTQASDEQVGTAVHLVMHLTEKVDVYEVDEYSAQGTDLVATINTLVDQMADFANDYFFGGQNAEGGKAFVAPFGHSLYMRRSGNGFCTYVRAPESLAPVFDWYDTYRDEVSVNATVKSLLESRDEQGLFDYILSGIGAVFSGDSQQQLFSGSEREFIRTFASALTDFELGEDYYLVPQTDGSISVAKGKEGLAAAGENATWTLTPKTQFSVEARLEAPALEDETATRYFTTLYTAFPYELPEGVSAYYVEQLTEQSDAENAELTHSARLVKVEGNAVPAETGVILECENSAAASNVLTILTDNVEPLSQNMLRGTTHLNAAQNDQTTVRVLSRTAQNGMGFYKLKATTTHLPANRAWLDLSGLSNANEVRSLSLVFSTTTAIATPQHAAQPQMGIFDVQGRRLTSEPTHGVYILNGRKVTR